MPSKSIYGLQAVSQYISCDISCAFASEISAKWLVISFDLVFVNKSGHFNPLIDLALVLVSRLRSAKGICNKDIFSFNIREFDFISNDSTNHSLYTESSKVIFNRFFSTATRGFCGHCRLSLFYHKCLCVKSSEPKYNN